MLRRTKKFAPLGSAALAILLASAATPALAQWPPYPTPNVPKLPNGKPDLKGPVPRTTHGHPDLTGIWAVVRPPNSGGGPPGSKKKRKIVKPPPGTPPLATFFDIGANMPDGLPLRPWAKKLKDKRMAAHDSGNPDAHCLPLGYMQFHLHPQPRRIVQTPQEIVIMYESNYGLRQIFTDGRALPNNDPQPWWYGYSVGHWDGDTLVVKSTDFRDGGWLDVHGSPLTDKATITERYRRLDFGHLQIDVTIDDPKAYTKPFTVRVNQRIMLNTNLIEFICNENEQDSNYYVK